MNLELIKGLLKLYKFTAKEYIEEDNSVTLSLDSIDLVVNAQTKDKAKLELSKSIKEYSEDFYKDFEFWRPALNRKEHIPFVLKAIIAENIDEITESIECRR